MKKDLNLHVWNSDVMFEFEEGSLAVKAVAFVDGPSRDMFVDSTISLCSISVKDIDAIIDFLNECKKEIVEKDNKESSKVVANMSPPIEDGSSTEVRRETGV